jgi:hypothetical protein
MLQGVSLCLADFDQTGTPVWGIIYIGVAVFYVDLSGTDAHSSQVVFENCQHVSVGGGVFNIQANSNDLDEGDEIPCGSQCSN